MPTTIPLTTHSAHTLLVNPLCCDYILAFALALPHEIRRTLPFTDQMDSDTARMSRQR
jgi:hypothetical protein